MLIWWGEGGGWWCQWCHKEHNGLWKVVGKWYIHKSLALFACWLNWWWSNKVYQCKNKWAEYTDMMWSASCYSFRFWGDKIKERKKKKMLRAHITTFPLESWWTGDEWWSDGGGGGGKGYRIVSWLV